MDKFRGHRPRYARPPRSFKRDWLNQSKSSTKNARPLSKSVQYFQKKQLDSRCVQHTATHFQASLSECEMLYTIDKSIIFWKYCSLFLRMCIFCTTFAPDLYQRRNLTACDLFKRMLKTCSTRPQTVACGFFLKPTPNPSLRAPQKVSFFGDPATGRE